MKTQKLIITAAFTLLTVTAVLLGCTAVQEGFIIPDGEEGLPDPRFAFVKNRWDNTVAAFTVNPTTGVLTGVSGSPFDIGDCCSPNLEADPAGRFVYVPIPEDTLVVLSVNQTTGALTPVAGSPFDIGDCNILFAKADPSGRYLYVTDTCLDAVFALSISSTGVPSNVTGSPYEVGPCPHGIAVDPDSRFVYVTDQCTDEIYGFTINATTGALTPVAGSPFISGEGGDLRFPAVDRSGRFLYATHHGNDEVYAFTINQTTGALTSAGEFATGCEPVGISTSPLADLVAVANWCDDSGTTISVFSINTTSGALTHVAGSPIDVGVAVNDVAFDPSGRFLYGTAPFAGDAGEVLGATVNPTTGVPTEITGSPFTAGLDEGSRIAITH